MDDDDEVLFAIEKTLCEDPDLREDPNAGNGESDEEILISETVMRGIDWDLYDFTSFLDTIKALEVDESFLKNAMKRMAEEKEGSEVAAKIFYLTLRGHRINEEYKKRRRERAKDPIKKTEGLLKKLKSKQEKLKADQEAAEAKIEELKTENRKKRKLNSESG